MPPTTELLTTQQYTKLLTDLSADLGIHLRNLQRTVTFYRTYRRPPALEGLSWAHYRIFMQLQDLEEHAFYEQLALPRPLTPHPIAPTSQSAHPAYTN